MNPQQFRDRQMQYEWWKQHGGGSNSGGGCGCLLLLIVGAIALMLLSGCSSRLQENNSVKPVSLTLSLSQEIVIL